VNAKLLVGGDGLALARDGKLVAVTNKLGANGVEEAPGSRHAGGQSRGRTAPIVWQRDHSDWAVSKQYADQRANGVPVNLAPGAATLLRLKVR
jgi:hypothetical protein